MYSVYFTNQMNNVNYVCVLVQVYNSRRAMPVSEASCQLLDAIYKILQS
jgi:hypothetical protein